MTRLAYVKLGFKRNSRVNYVEIGWNLWGMHPDRAPTIVAGVVILVEAMRAFGLEKIAVSEHDILYGAAIATAASRT